MLPKFQGLVRFLFCGGYKLKLNGKPLAIPEGDSRISQFMRCSMVLVDLLQQDHKVSALERLAMDNYLRLIEISYKSWKRRKDGRPKKAI